jgi:hypothetical protein
VKLCNSMGRKDAGRDEVLRLHLVTLVWGLSQDHACLSSGHVSDYVLFVFSFCSRPRPSFGLPTPGFSQAQETTISRYRYSISLEMEIGRSRAIWIVS